MATGGSGSGNPDQLINGDISPETVTTQLNPQLELNPQPNPTTQLNSTTQSESGFADTRAMDEGGSRQQVSGVPVRSSYSFDATPSGEVRFRLPYTDSGLGGIETICGSDLRRTAELPYTSWQEQPAVMESIRRPIDAQQGGAVTRAAIGDQNMMSVGYVATDWRPSTGQSVPGMSSRNRAPIGVGVSEGTCLPGGERSRHATLPPLHKSGRGVRGPAGGYSGFDGTSGHLSVESETAYEHSLARDMSGHRDVRQDGSHFGQTHTYKRSPQRLRKPATYDGKTSWRDYLVQFEMVAEINGWDEQTMALELATSLRAAAQGVLGDLRPDHRRSWTHLVSALTDRFEPDNQSELYRAQIKNRLRRRGEPLSELAQEIKRLIRKAYPSAPPELREQLGRDCFADSLNDAEMEWTVFSGKPNTVDDALRTALEYEAFQKGRRTGGRQGIRMQRASDTKTPEMENINQRLTKIETADVPKPAPQSDKTGQNQGNRNRPRSGKCHYCGEAGHWISDCDQRKNDMTNRRQAYSPSSNKPSGN
jgi:hypothetical protein